MRPKYDLASLLYFLATAVFVLTLFVSVARESIPVLIFGLMLGLVLIIVADKRAGRY